MKGTAASGTPAPAHVRELAWEAVHALREAESLAQLAHTVSGPADTPPTSLDDFDSWTADFIGRSRAVLATQADQTLRDASPSMRDKLREVARAIRRGAGKARDAIDAINSVGPVAVAQKLWRHRPSLTQLKDAAGTVLGAATLTYGAGLLILAAVVWYLLKRR